MLKKILLLRFFSGLDEKSVGGGKLNRQHGKFRFYVRQVTFWVEKFVRRITKNRKIAERSGYFQQGGAGGRITNENITA
ncbi:hypothetical protein [Necropsobacter massiliensis]|uniref:hypothetical protein n=1 Tax=Necropsobacter massiliensis TaxID=1400001 RepID=UPI0005963758|nr:hypothetical protein [Necropsobacter massiliensis]